MTPKSDKQRYVEFAQEKQNKRKALEAMTQEMRGNLEQIKSDLGETLQYIEDCKDLRLSDIAKIENAFWKLSHVFDTEINDHLQGKFEEYSIILDDDYGVTVPK